MAGTQFRERDNQSLIEKFRAEARTCRVELLHTSLRERRFELQARAEHMDELADELAKN